MVKGKKELLRRTYGSLRSSILNIRFLQGILLSCIIYIFGALPWLYSTSYVYVFVVSREFSSFIFLLPVCAAFPCALQYRENRKSRMDAMILQRCTPRRYLNGLFIRAGISGFLVMAAGVLAYLAVIPLIFPDAVISYEAEIGTGIILPYLEGFAQKGQWGAYFGIYMLLAGIAGTFWAVLPLMISAWVDNLYAIFVMPILFLYAMDYLLARCGMASLSTIMLGMGYFDSWQAAVWQALVTYGGMSICCYAVFYLKAGKRCHEMD